MEVLVEDTKKRIHHPFWSPEEIEIQKKIYGEICHHSAGMISFRYRPPTPEDLEKLKETELYKQAQLEK